MLSIEKFTSRLIRPNHPDQLHVGVDSKDESQLYIIVNGGMANINCAPIELYAPEIKHCALEMIEQSCILKHTKNHCVLAKEKVFIAIQ